MSGAVLSGCGDDNADRVASSAADALTTTESAATSTTPAATGATAPADSTVTSGSATSVELTELLDDGMRFVGSLVTVRGRAFFVETCPPPTTAGPGPCVISMHLAEPERADLPYAERDEAIPVLQGGRGVSCEVGGGVTTACPGWENGAVYELTGRVLARPGSGGAVVIDLAG